MTRILITRRWPGAVEEALAERHDVRLNPADTPMTEAELIAAMRRADILCPTVSDRIGAAVIEASDRQVRLIANYGAGTDHIDLEAARRAGIMVTNTPDVLTGATAELALLLMLMTARRAGEGERELRSGQWAGWRPTHMLGRSLEGATLGLVGFGRIAQETARRAKAALGVRITYHSRNRSPSGEAALDAHYLPSLEALVAEADILSLHCPGGEATRHLIDARILATMRPGSILINTARGSVVDEAALAQALVSGPLGAAGLDVFEREPAVNPALLALPNVVLLPHLGSATIETRTAMGMRVVSNIEAWLAGNDPPDRVV